MNKKIILSIILPLLAIAFISAGILNHYGVFSQELNVNQIDVLNLDPAKMDCDAGETCREKSFTIFNDLGNERKVKITNDAEAGIDVRYVGTLELTKKNTEDWTHKGEHKTIEYTIVGDTFEVSGVPVNHTLIYYKDNEANANDDNRLVTIGEIGSVNENLPHANDWNAGDLADYCDNEINDNYDSCRGAKLWAVPNSDIVNGSLTWANMDEYWYETNLVQYNQEGEIIIYPGQSLELIPEYTLNILLTAGNYIVNTTVNVTE